MIRPALVSLLAIVLTACGPNNVEKARTALANSIVIKTDLEVSDVASYPGDVVCGAFTAYVSYHEAQKENAPFIYRGGEIDRNPRPRDWRIFCDENPAAKLAPMAGFGPITRESGEWLQIIDDFIALEDALEAYYTDNYAYPSSEQGLAALLTKPESKMPLSKYREGGYLKAIPTDPWGNTYEYTATQWGRTKGSFEIISRGRDGQPGGESLDSDINSRYLRYYRHIIGIL